MNKDLHNEILKSNGEKLDKRKLVSCK